MGREKSFVNYKGKPLINYSIDLMKQVCKEIIISANNTHFNKLGFTVVPDKQSNGPASGIVACLPHCSENYCLVIATDTPNISTELIQHLYKHKSANKITVAQHKEHLEPLCAIYPKALHSQIQKLLSSGERKLYIIINKVGFVGIDINNELPFYTNQLFFNVNKMSDLYHDIE